MPPPRRLRPGSPAGPPQRAGVYSAPPQRSSRRPSLLAGSSRREAGVGATGPTRTSGLVPAVPTIVVLLALGLALRLIIAYVLLPGSGFQTDLGSFQAWG